MPERLPWARERTLRALLATTWLVVAHGPRTFASRVGARDDERAVSYASAVTLVSFAPLLVVPFLAAFAWERGGGLEFDVCCWLATTTPVLLVGQLLRGALYGLVYHGLAHLLGGQASSESSFSAAFVSLGLFPVELLLLGAGMLPGLASPASGVPWFLGGIALAYVASILWGVALVVPHARERHRLSAVRAVVAALVPSMLGLVPYLLAMTRTTELAARAISGD